MKAKSDLAVLTEFIWRKKNLVGKGETAIIIQILFLIPEGILGGKKYLAMGNFF